MIADRSRVVRVAVAGAKPVVEGVRSGGAAVDRSIDAYSVDDRMEQGTDCLVIDRPETAEDVTALIEHRGDAKRPVPVVLLVSDWAADDVLAALTVDDVVTLPRALLDADTGLLVERLVEAVERTNARTSFSELYDDLPCIVTVHEPTTGSLLFANQTLCDLLGSDRETVAETCFEELVADVSGFDPGRALDVFSNASKRTAPVEFEWPVRTAEEDVRWVESQLRSATFDGSEVVLSTSVDVTDRSRQQHRYEQVFDNVNDVITIHDPWERALVDLNESAAELTGYDREQLLEMGLGGFSVTDDGYTRDRAYDIQQRVAASGEPETTDWLIETASGEHRRLECRLSPARIAGEDRVLVLARDVTERRQLEQTYQDLFENVSDGLVIHDPETGEIRDVNQGFCELNGYEREELVGETIDIVTAPHHGLEAAQERIRAARADGPQLFEWRNQRRDGTTFPAEIHLRVVEIRGEERVLASVRDITERKRREREYEQLFDGVTESIAVQDPETAELVDANQQLVERLGYDDLETVLEQDFDALSAVDAGYTKEKAQALCQQVIESGEPETVEWQQETVDGETIWIEAKLNPAVIGGEKRVVSMQRDVTERRQREREYEQIFDNVNDAIVVFHPETAEILDVNDTYHDILGYDDLETIQELGIEGLSLSEAGYTGERGRALIREVAETGEPKTVEWRAETRDGEPIWLEPTLATAEIGGEQRVLSLQRDITERKRREREYEQVFNGVHDAIGVFNPETYEMVAVNDRLCELTGYDREEILAQTNLVSAADEGYDIDRAKELLDAAMETTGPHEREWRLETADGEHLTVDVRATATTIGDEDRVIVVSRDITEKRLTERRLRAIVDRIDEAIYMTRADAIVVGDQEPDYVSSGYETIWGQSLEEIAERNEDGFFGTLHAEDASDYRAFVEGVVDDVYEGVADDRYSFEYRIERPDGEGRWVHSDYYPIQWETGHPRVVIVTRDVTHRKARERRIASFDDATDDLATADTPAEATRTAVDAATEALNLPAVGAFLYDGDAGVLAPEMFTGSLPSGVAAEPVRPGDGALWEAFAAGEAVAPGDGQEATSASPERDDAPRELDELADWRALALGNHGILLVGSADRTLDAETIHAAHVLAATLEAALNHLQGEQRLAAQEAELRTQTERAERLDRIARLTQQVEAAITDASTPRDVERAVCERLASSGPYELAWVGGLEAGADTLAARAVVGGTDRYVDSLSLETTGETADPHPAVTAWQTDDVHVTDSIVDTGPAGDWRQLALSAGYQSICAVPLTYDGITHGVLSVATERPNAFGDREQQVLAQLGTSIGDAIVAIERRRALESDETVQLEFEGPGESLSFARAATAADCRVTLERTVARQDGSVSVYFSFDRGVPADVAAIATDALRGTVDVVAEESTSTLVEVRTDDWFGSPLAEYGGVLRTATADPDGTTIAVEVPQQADVRSFVERLQAIAPSLDLVARRQHSQQALTPTELSDHVRAELTDRQFEVLQTALSAGYFEWPRDNDGSAVADRLDITQPTLNKHLRLAEKQIFTLLLEGDP